MSRLLLAAAVLGLAGCAVTPPAPVYGNFLPSTVTAPWQPSLAESAVQLLRTLYPPGRTQLVLQQVVSDPFGQALVTALRAQGYALQEFLPVASAPTAPARTAAPAHGAEPAVPLGYVLDQAAGPDSTRLTLTVGAQTLTRVYWLQRGQLQPAGAWLRKQ